MDMVKAALLSATALVGLATGPMSATAAPITLFNTGVTNSGAVQANTAAELHYTLVSAPGGVVPLRDATSANGFPIPPWLGDNSLSAWVGPTATDLSGPVGPYDYRVTFSLAGLIPSTASITGQWSSDNAGTDILINGVSTGNTAAGFSAFYAFNIASGFVSGLNTLDFLVRNDGGPTGLRVEMTGTANAVVASVPEPATLALVGTGLLGLALGRRKHR